MNFTQQIYALARRQPWLYDRAHDSMHARPRKIVHAVIRVGTLIHNLRYRLFPVVGDGTLLNLGSGRRPLPGWVNVDINPFAGAQLWTDLRNRWAVADDSVAVIYSRHCMEHFNEAELRGILRQCFRVLRPGAGLRIGVPSLDIALAHYMARDFAFVDWLHQRDPAALNFVRYITDNGNHPIILDFEYLATLLTDEGFADVERCDGGSSRVVAADLLPAGDHATDKLTLYVEAKKPAGKAASG